MTPLGSARRGVLASSFAAALLVGLAGNVAAAPSGGGAWETFPLTCAGETFIVTASPGTWSVGHVVDETGKHVVAWAYTINVVDITTGEVLFAAGTTKPGTRGQDSVECFDHTVDIDPDTGDTIVVDFTTVVFILGPSAA